MTRSTGNKEYSAVDIERYHSGQMSAEERHALEKAALDDAFLSDALEGYAYTATASEDVLKLQTRLNEKTGKNKVVPLFFSNRKWIRAAAVILVVAGSMWLLYRIFLPEDSSMAVQKNPQEK